MNNIGIVIIGGILLVYVVAFIFYIYYYSKRTEWSSKAAFFFTLMGFIFECAYLLSSLGPEFFSTYNMVIVISAIIVLAFILIKQFNNWDIMGLFVTPASAILLAISIIAFDMRNHAPIEKGGMLLFSHIATAIAGEAAYFVASMISIIYLIAHRRLKAKSRMSAGGQGYFPPLEKLDIMSFRVLVAGFPFATLGALFGFALDFVHYGTIFSANFTKEVFVVALWLLFVVMIIGRYRFGLMGKRMSIFILVGQILVFLILVVPKFLTTGSHNF